MKKAVVCRYGVIAYAPDLTRPKAEIHPVAVVGSGRFNQEEGFLFILALPHLPERLKVGDDAVSAAILGRLPKYLDEQLELGLSVVGPDNVLRWLTDRLKGNLALTKIGEEQFTVDPANLVQETLNRFFGVLLPEPNFWSFGKPKAEPTPPAYRFEPVALAG